MALDVLHLAVVPKVSSFDPCPCFSALFAMGALTVAARTKESIGGALCIVCPIAVLCLAPLAGAFLQGLRDALLIVAG